MKCVALLFQFAFIAQAQATDEPLSPEDEEALNKLIDTLVDDDKNDELVDMVADKLVNKLLGFEIASMPNLQAMQMRPPVAEVRQMMQSPQEFQTAVAPQVNVAYDDSKLTNLGKNIPKDRTSGNKRWGTPNKEKPVQGGVNPYASVAYPQIDSRPEGPNKEPIRGFEKDFRIVGVDAVKNKPSKEYACITNRECYKAGAPNMRADGFLGLSGSEQELAAERADTAAGGKLMELDSEEEPDALTILAVGIASAFVGSAATFILFHLRRSFTKTEMQAPLLNPM